MAAEVGNNGAWCGYKEDCSTFITFDFVSLPNKRVGDPGNMKVQFFRECNNMLNNSQCL